MSSRPILAEALALIREEVDGFFEGAIVEVTDTRARLSKAMRYAAIGGGKRLRPLLTTACASLFHVKRDSAVWAGCAIEAVHIYSLIHDDLPCMDDDDMRHGRPSLHRAFDEATAVLAGDTLLAFAFDIVSDAKFANDPNMVAEMTRCLAKASGFDGMVGGQMMDMMSESEEGPEHDLAMITRLQQLKTGALLAASIEMGLILGRVPEEGRAALRAYARDIGLAFQIADDLLDVEGDAERAGKALRKDAARGKKTFVSILGVDGARAQAHALCEQAIAHLGQYGAEAELLREVAKYIIERDK